MKTFLGASAHRRLHFSNERTFSTTWICVLAGQIFWRYGFYISAILKTSAESFFCRMWMNGTSVVSIPFLTMSKKKVGSRSKGSTLRTSILGCGKVPLHGIQKTWIFTASTTFTLESQSPGTVTLKYSHYHTDKYPILLSFAASYCLKQKGNICKSPWTTYQLLMIHLFFSLTHTPQSIKWFFWLFYAFTK